MPSSSWTKTSWQWSMHSPSPVHRSWSIHTRIAPGTLSRSASPYPGRVIEPRVEPRVEPPVEPRAKHVAHVHHRPTGDVDDPFQWLRDRDDPDTVAYLEAENAYANAWFDERKDLVDELFEEIKSRVQETDISAPIPVDDWWYVSRTEEGLSYPIHCRGRAAASAADEVLLDENAEAGDHDFFEVGAFEVSPDHRLLAWSADIDGHEHYTLRVRDLADHSELPDEVPDTTAWAGVAWSADCTHLYYVVADAQERPYRVMRHRLGTAPADDVEVYRDDDARF